MSVNVRSTVPVGTNQNPWKCGLPPGTTSAALCTNSSSAPAASAYDQLAGTLLALPNQAGELAAPAATSLSSGIFVHRVSDCNQLAFKFYASGSDGNTGSAYIYTLNRLSQGNLAEWHGAYLGKLDFTIGQSVVLARSQIIPAGSCFWCDTITASTNNAYASPGSTGGGWAIYGANAADGVSIAVADVMGPEFLVVVLRRSTATGVGFCWREV